MHVCHWLSRRLCGAGDTAVATKGVVVEETGLLRRTRGCNGPKRTGRRGVYLFFASDNQGKREVQPKRVDAAVGRRHGG